MEIKKIPVVNIKVFFKKNQNIISYQKVVFILFPKNIKFIPPLFTDNSCAFTADLIDTNPCSVISFAECKELSGKLTSLWWNWQYSCVEIFWQLSWTSAGFFFSDHCFKITVCMYEAVCMEKKKIEILVSNKRIWNTLRTVENSL